jgi:anti-anti-sigma regulatory factor
LIGIKRITRCPRSLPLRAEASKDLIRVEGELDGLAARRLEALLGGLPEGTRVRLDLTGVSRMYDFGVAVLASALTRCRAAVELLGLHARRARELAALGVDTRALERALVPVPVPVRARTHRR